MSLCVSVFVGVCLCVGVSKAVACLCVCRCVSVCVRTYTSDAQMCDSYVRLLHTRLIQLCMTSGLCIDTMRTVTRTVVCVHAYMHDRKRLIQLCMTSGLYMAHPTYALSQAWSMYDPHTYDLGRHDLICIRYIPRAHPGRCRRRPSFRNPQPYSPNPDPKLCPQPSEPETENGLNPSP